MSDDTGIEWTDATWNPTRGCRRTAPGGSKQSGCGDASGAGCHADRPAPDGIDPIDWLQVRLAAWEARQPFHVASALPVGAGCSEEAGELADAESPDEIEGFITHAMSCYTRVAAKILARDWRADAVTGGGQ